MPIKCPVCDGVATASGGCRRLSDKIRKIWYVCKNCKARIPGEETKTIVIFHDEIVKG